MKKILIILFLLLLASCSIDNDSVFTPVEKETLDEKIEYTLRSESTKDIDSKEILIQDYWVTNPTSNAKLDVTIYQPNDNEKHPSVILVPGGLGSKEDFLEHAFSREINYLTQEIFASEGFIVLIFSADGRGDSEGKENFNGYIQQDGLYQLYRFLSENEQTESIGIISFSYGIVMASGMLGRYQPNLNYYIEWEGPVDRYFVTHNCDLDSTPALEEGITCEDDNYWEEREALRFVPYFEVDHFVIVQDVKDHFQNNWKHSLTINNLAVQHLDWVRVNGPENEINQRYTYDTFPASSIDLKNPEILSYAKEFV